MVNLPDNPLMEKGIKCQNSNAIATSAACLVFFFPYLDCFRWFRLWSCQKELCHNQIDLRDVNMISQTSLQYRKSKNQEVAIFSHWRMTF